MKQINFCTALNGKYTAVLDSFIGQITPWLRDYSCGKPIKAGVNVYFFVESQPSGDVFISHGLADKNWRNASRLKNFDYVFVSGPSWVEKLAEQGLERKKIVVTGYPKLDPLFKGEIKKRPRDRQRVLWAPTHTAIKSISSYPGLESCLKNLPSDLELITSLHPANKPGHSITLQQLADADVVIGDAGSIAYEAMALNKPVVYPDWIIKDGIMSLLKGTFEEMIFKQKIGLHVDTPMGLIDAFYKAIENGLDAKARKFIDGIFPLELRGGSGEKTAWQLVKIAGMEGEKNEF